MRDNDVPCKQTFNESVVCMNWSQPEETDKKEKILKDDEEDSEESDFEQKIVGEITPSLVEGARLSFISACEYAAIAL